MRSLKVYILIIVSPLLSATSALAAFVTSPNVTNGNAGGPGPLLVTRDLLPSYRYQEVHASSDFQNLTALPLLITEISFAPRREGQPAIDVTVPSVDLRFSTTTRYPDSLSPVFAENTGIGETVVLSGAIHVFDNRTERFGIHIQLQQPFIYDPSLGNLLLDFRNFATIAPPPTSGYVLEGQFTFSDSVSAVGGEVNDTSGTFGTGGYVTRFTYTPVPEPGTWALLCIGFFGIALFRRSRAPNKRMKRS